MTRFITNIVFGQVGFKPYDQVYNKNCVWAGRI